MLPVQSKWQASDSSESWRVLSLIRWQALVEHERWLYAFNTILLPQKHILCHWVRQGLVHCRFDINAVDSKCLYLRLRHRPSRAAHEATEGSELSRLRACTDHWFFWPQKVWIGAINNWERLQESCESNENRWRDGLIGVRALGNGRHQTIRKQIQEIRLHEAFWHGSCRHSNIKNLIAVDLSIHYI